MRRPHVYERSVPRVRRPPYHDDGSRGADLDTGSDCEVGSSETRLAVGSPIVIGLSGLAGAGKSTAARHMVEHHGFVRRPFAALLKGMLRSLLAAQGVPADTVDRMVEGDLKEVPCLPLGGRTPRFAMQTLGTEWGRALSPDLWVDAWAASLTGLERVVADDVRFANEVAAVHRLGGLVLEIRRPGIPRLTGTHESEAGVEADAVLMNSETPAMLAVRVEARVASLTTLPSGCPAR